MTVYMKSIRSFKAHHKTMMCVFAVAIVAVVALYMFPSLPRSIRRLSEGFSGGGDYHMVMFKANWCGYCQKALPTYQNIMGASNGIDVGGRKLFFDIIDPEVDTSKVVVTSDESGMKVEMKTSYAPSQSVAISGYPTYVLFGPSGPIQYKGALDGDAMIGFAKSQ